MNLRGATKWLLVAALGLPLVQAVLFWVRAMLAAMGDSTGSDVVGLVSTLCHVVWAVSLVGVVVVLALIVIDETPEEDE